MGASAKQEVAGWPTTATGGAAQRRRGKTEQAGWRKGIKDLNAISKNSKDPTVKQRELLKYGSNEKVPNMKVVQIFKIYNFDVVPKLI